MNQVAYRPNKSSSGIYYDNFPAILNAIAEAVSDGSRLDVIIDDDGGTVGTPIVTPTSLGPIECDMRVSIKGATMRGNYYSLQTGAGTYFRCLRSLEDNLQFMGNGVSGGGPSLDYDWADVYDPILLVRNGVNLLLPAGQTDPMGIVPANVVPAGSPPGTYFALDFDQGNAYDGTAAPTVAFWKLLDDGTNGATLLVYQQGELYGGGNTNLVQGGPLTSLTVAHDCCQYPFAFDPSYFTGTYTDAALDDAFYIDYRDAATGNWSGAAPTRVYDAINRCAALLKTLNGGVGP